MRSVTRRQVLRRAGQATARLAVGLPVADLASGSQSAAPPATKRLKVIVAGGHPGDLDKLVATSIVL